jgi:hypothetical protein
VLSCHEGGEWILYPVLLAIFKVMEKAGVFFCILSENTGLTPKQVHSPSGGLQLSGRCGLGCWRPVRPHPLSGPCVP